MVPRGDGFTQAPGRFLQGAEGQPELAMHAGRTPTREAMAEQVAHQFGFDSWEEFRAAAERRLGKAVVRRLERELARYPRAGS
ncbi:hypothetical protein DYI95_008315 [Thermaerobacter sp. PB12/4term]|uniref:hypothetical protein n=1 Tax=Thermaerobacter sp. PB12/4term TaxID=2293838 RepID=UPI000E32C331|nr:hypothetical protein [Thermaerobacter sp. PB12/4term]QIA27523.1 hypothetical protein DYI95_008315 [Thermaerobacter sp. PB12/4term]